MSLLVWLPLTQDLRNNGIDDSTFSIYGSNTTVNNSGKLGKCYTNNSHSGGGLISNKTVDLGQNQSMFCWFKFSDLESSSSLGGGLVSAHRYGSNSGMGITIKYVSATTGYLSVNTGTGSARTYNTYTGTTLLQANTWYHGGYTYDGSTLKIYVNGICEKTQAISGMSVPADYITVFCWSLAGSSGASIHGDYKLYGDINDVRVYNHTLSEKEIKELAKGLVAHYPLNNNTGGQLNLLKNSNFTEGSSGSQGYNFNSSSWSKQSDCMKIVSTSAATGLYTANFDSVTTGDMATFSAYVKADSTMTIYIGVDGSGIGDCVSYTVGTSWKRISISKAKTTNNANLRVYGNGTFYVRHMKYELGSKVTSWQANSADSIYTSMGYNTLVEYDVAGYDYHGTKNKIMNIEPNTAKYSVSTVFDGNTDSIQIPFNTMLGLTAAGKADYTISVWTYKTSIGSKGYQTILGGPSGFELEARNASGTDPQYVAWNWGKPVATYEFNKWCLFTFVHTSTDCKIYVNGEYISTGSSTNVPIGNFFIGAWNSTTQQNYEGKMSDFRIYATALSADDIKELYQSASSIDKNGNLFAYEFIEN